MTTTTKARPILFSAPMIRSLLAGTKTMTRRLVKFNHKPWLEPLPHVEYARDGMPIWWSSPPSEEIRQSDYYDHGMPCPYGRVGDILWVKEAFRLADDSIGPAIFYAADDSGERLDHFENRWLRGNRFAFWDDERSEYMRRQSWRSSIHMPKWASRITLEITSVRVERVQEIGKDGRKAHDVLAEGITPEQIAQNAKWFHKDDAPAVTFSQLWDKVNGAGSWMRNDWVWAIAFRRIEQEATP